MKNEVVTIVRVIEVRQDGQVLVESIIRDGPGWRSSTHALVAGETLQIVGTTVTAEEMEAQMANSVKAMHVAIAQAQRKIV